MRKNNFWVSAAALASVSAAAGLVYSNSLSGSFHLDDFYNIVSNPAVKNLADIKSLWAFFPSRFATFLTFALNYRLGGLDVLGWHIVNVSLHAGCAFFCWLLARTLLKTPAMKNSACAGHQIAIPLLAALYFAVHPVQTQAVDYAYQRAAVLCAFFYLASVFFYSVHRLGGKSRYYWVSLAAAIFALFSKETAFSLPLALAAVEFLFFGGSIKKIIPFALLWPAAFAAVRFSPTYVDVARLSSGGGIGPLAYLSTQPAVIIKYLRLLVFPAGQRLLYDFPVYLNPLALKPLSSLAALAAGVSLAVWFFRKNRLLIFCLAWFFLALAVESGPVPLQDLIFEHRLYLPLFGASLFFAAAQFEILRPKKIWPLLVFNAALLAALAAAAYLRNPVWTDEKTLWRDNAKKSPGIAAPYNNLGVAYLNDGDYGCAASLFERALAVDPAFTRAYNNLGYALYRLGEKEKAAECFEKAIPGNPDADGALNNLGNIWLEKRNYKKALGYYLRAAELNPANDLALANAGLAFRLLKDYKNAAVYYEKAVRANPDFAEAGRNLAELRAKR